MKGNGKQALLLGAGLCGLGLLAVGSSARGRQTIQRVGATVSETLEEGFEWMERVVRRTSAHEGTYDSLNLNSDNAGLSFGILQWAQRTGSLGWLLEELQKADPAKFAAIFGPAWQALLQSTKAGSLEPVEGALLWKAPWIERFKAAGREPVFRAVQDRLARDGLLMKAAIEAAKLLGVTTERGLSITYDTACQQGHGAAVKYAKQVAAQLQGQVLPAREVLKRYITRCAAPFISLTPPKKHSNPNLEWRKVGNEWHVFAGKFDLYLNITKRRNGLADDPNLGDAQVRTA